MNKNIPVDSVKDTHPSIDDEERLKALQQYRILDTSPEREYDDLTQLAAYICNTPIALINLLDENRYWFKSKLGVDVCEAPRDGGFCVHVLAAKELLVIEDVRNDPRFQHSPLVIRPPHIRFYAGAPLITPEGIAIGTLCVMDTTPKKLTEQQIAALQSISHHVVMLLELRKNNEKLEQALAGKNRIEQELRLIQQELEQRVQARSAALVRMNDELEAEIIERVKEKNFSDTLINSLPGAFYVFDEQGKFLRWNQHFITVLGYSEKDMASKHPLEFFALDERRRVGQAIEEVLSVGHAWIEANLLTKNGQQLPYLFSGTGITVNGKYCVCGMGIDISSRRHAEQSSYEAEERYRMVVELSPTAIFVVKGDTCIFANEAAIRLVGAIRPDQIVGQPILKIVHPDYHEFVARRIRTLETEWRTVPRIEEKFIKLDGTIIDVEVAAAPFMFGGEPARVVVAHDITSAKTYQAQLQHQANYDALTGLPNRHLLVDRINQTIAHCERNKTHAHVIFLDLDNFKLVNDSLGHHAGDKLLKLISDRMQGCLRKEDTLARLGGDEFVLLISGQTSEELAQNLLPRILNNIDRPCWIENQEIYATCSIGISSYPEDGEDVSTLLKRADMAMYRAKETGRNRFQFYTMDMNEKIDERMQLQMKLQRALEREEFRLYYQPKVDLKTGCICGAEALLRWHPHGSEAISPAKFIAVAEETGLIVRIGEWVLRQACEQYKEWKELGLKPIDIAVNCSPRQFLSQNFVASIKQVLQETGMDPSHLEIEVTEGALMERPDETISILQSIKSMGIHLSVDDFGTGYSSLSYLKRFPLDRLKIDQSFVRDLPHDEDDAAIVEAVTSLGHSLGLKVTAEGVETKEQAEFLSQHYSDEVQGYYYSRPLPSNEFAALLRGGIEFAT